MYCHCCVFSDVILCTCTVTVVCLVMSFSALVPWQQSCISMVGKCPLLFSVLLVALLCCSLAELQGTEAERSAAHEHRIQQVTDRLMEEKQALQVELNTEVCILTSR